MAHTNDLAVQTVTELRALLAQISFNLNSSSQIDMVMLSSLRRDAGKALDVIGKVDFMLTNQAMERDAFRGELNKVVDNIAKLQDQLNPQFIKSATNGDLIDQFLARDNKNA